MAGVTISRRVLAIVDACFVVLVGIAPAALACHALPFTGGAARLWWRALLACLGVVVLQALILHTTVSVIRWSQVIGQRSPGRRHRRGRP